MLWSDSSVKDIRDFDMFGVQTTSSLLCFSFSICFFWDLRFLKAGIIFCMLCTLSSPWDPRKPLTPHQQLQKTLGTVEWNSATHTSRISFSPRSWKNYQQYQLGFKTKALRTKLLLPCPEWCFNFTSTPELISCYTSAFWDELKVLFYHYVIYFF